MQNKTINRKQGFRAKSTHILNNRRAKGRHVLAKSR